MFEYMGMNTTEFLANVEDFSESHIKEAIHCAKDEVYFLEYDMGGVSSELADLYNFIETLETELTVRSIEKVNPKLAMIFAYENDYGFVAYGTKTYPFVTIEQCKAVLEKLYRENLKLESVQLVGRGKYDGTLLTDDVSVVLSSLS